MTEKRKYFLQDVCDLWVVSVSRVLLLDIFILRCCITKAKTAFTDLLTALKVTGATHSGTAPFPIIPSSWQADGRCNVLVPCLSRIISHQADTPQHPTEPWRNTETHTQRKMQLLYGCECKTTVQHKWYEVLCCVIVWFLRASWSLLSRTSITTSGNLEFVVIRSIVTAKI